LALYSIVEECKKNKREISYYSSWTIHPKIRENKLNVKFLKEVLTAVTLLHHKEQQVHELLGLGVPRFKTNEYFTTWGYEEVKYQGKLLPRIYIETYSNVEVVFMHLKEFSNYAYLMSEKYLNLWKERIKIGDKLDFEKLKKQVA